MRIIQLLTATAVAATAVAGEPQAPLFNREPLVAKPYAELPLGAIRPDAWLRDELERMAAGMTGHLDEWYPEVCGPRNAWLGGDGDTWERGPYWIDGLYPLALILGDKALEAKALKWIDWTIENQREDGYIGPVELKDEDRTQPPPSGAQIEQPDDWWPRMVMLKILQQHIMATNDPRAIDCLKRYFKYQLKTLPGAPLHDPRNPESGSWWAAERGGDNLLVVLWLYNLTGEKYLIELADLIHEQTVPVTDWFTDCPENMVKRTAEQGHALHCVNLAQMMKTPTIRWQQDQEQRHLDATENAFDDIRTFHGQPHGLYGGDEGMHGRAPSRGSELCTAVEMMFSLEKMLEVTGNTKHADRLEKIAFNALPTQSSDDHRTRQYFQQTNQVAINHGDQDFFDDGGERLVHGLTNGYPCCTCNLHQGWPKFAQHLWFATNDKGLAALVYAPSTVTANVADGRPVTLRQSGGYPFRETVTIDVEAPADVRFPLHLRIPGWAEKASININGKAIASRLKPGSIHIENRLWKDGDQVTLRFPMKMRQSRWYNRSVAIERGPLVYALDVPDKKVETVRPAPKGAPANAMHRGYIEHLPTGPWNYGIPEGVLRDLDAQVKITTRDIAANPWTRATAPVTLETHGIRIPDWTINRRSAADVPLSPVDAPTGSAAEPIRLIPYGATTLRIAAFPVVSGSATFHRSGDATITASHVFGGDSLAALRDGNTDPGKRHTFWPHKGTSEWVQYTFDNPLSLTTSAITWFDDSDGGGQCKAPESWKLLYQEDGKWKPLETKPDPSDPGKVSFSPITTPALRLEIKLRANASAGILEWQVR